MLGPTEAFLLLGVGTDTQFPTDFTSQANLISFMLLTDIGTPISQLP